MRKRTYRKIKYRHGEKNLMKNMGFPFCIPDIKKGGEHCNTCIKLYRRLLAS